MDNDDLNKNIDNKKLLEEIEGLENDSSNQENTINSKVKINKENIIIIVLIVIVIIGIIYTYLSNSEDGISLNEFDKYLEEDYFSNYDDDEYDYFDDDEYYYDDEDDEYYDQDQEEEKFNNQKLNLVISQETLNVNKKLVAAIKNQNSENVFDFDVYVVFFDGENKVIGVDYNSIDLVKSNYEYYTVFEETPDNFERYEFFITKSFFYSSDTTILDDQVSYDVNESDGNVVINFKNNSNKLIDYMSFSIVYYDEENKILDVEELYEFDVKKNSSGELVGYGIWNYTDNTDVKYSRYEVIFNYAVSY